MPLIVIEGLDGSGKATNANALYEKLRSLGKKVKKISFPDYESDSSALVKMYLAGDFGKRRRTSMRTRHPLFTRWTDLQASRRAGKRNIIAATL